MKLPMLSFVFIGTVLALVGCSKPASHAKYSPLIGQIEANSSTLLSMSRHFQKPPRHPARFNPPIHLVPPQKQVT